MVERIRRDDDAPTAVAAVENAFCALARHWVKIVAFEKPEQWLEHRLLSDTPMTVPPEAVPIDADAAWQSMRARLARDHIRYRVIVTLATAFTIALIMLSALLEGFQYHRHAPPPHPPVVETTTT